MNAKFKAENPNEIEMTLTVTMPLKEWKRLRDQLEPRNYPSSLFFKKINELVNHAEEHFHPLNVEEKG